MSARGQTKRVWEARIVQATLKRALEGVVAAQANTTDASLAGMIERTRKELEPAVRRAGAVARDLELLDAPQAELLDAGAEPADA